MDKLTTSIKAAELAANENEVEFSEDDYRDGWAEGEGLAGTYTDTEREQVLSLSSSGSEAHRAALIREYGHPEREDYTDGFLAGFYSTLAEVQV